MQEHIWATQLCCYAPSLNSQRSTHGDIRTEGGMFRRAAEVLLEKSSIMARTAAPSYSSLAPRKARKKNPHKYANQGAAKGQVLTTPPLPEKGNGQDNLPSQSASARWTAMEHEPWRRRGIGELVGATGKKLSLAHRGTSLGTGSSSSSFLGSIPCSSPPRPSAWKPQHRQVVNNNSGGWTLRTSWQAIGNHH